jgi:hypothetical protein
MGCGCATGTKSAGGLNVEANEEIIGLQSVLTFLSTGSAIVDRAASEIVSVCTGRRN